VSNVNFVNQTNDGSDNFLLNIQILIVGYELIGGTMELQMGKIYHWLIAISVVLLGICSVPAALSAVASTNKIKQLLNLSLQELMDVEVKAADKVSEKIGEIPASVVLITRQDIETYGYTDLDELLEHVSGMYRTRLTLFKSRE
jgi:hypothetical protein